MTYTVRNCRSYGDTVSVLAQELDSEGKVIAEDFFYGFQGEGRVKRAVKRALGELMWDVKQGFTGGEVYVEGRSKR